MSAKISNSSDISRDLKILAVADDQADREILRAISSWGFAVQIVDSSQALEQALTFAPDVLLIDLEGDEKVVAAMMRELQARGIEVATIIVAPKANIDAIAGKIVPGACDLLSQPINPSLLHALLNRLKTQLAVAEENQHLRRKLIETGVLGPLIGQSIAMRRVMRLVEEAAASTAPALIVGENGTGKKMVARTIHDLSARREHRYVAVNCTGLPNHLIESELWGRERGAYPGADRSRDGFLEMANGGTLLLDEITDLRAELQAKLLRTIEDRKFHRVGGSDEMALDIRIIASSSRNLVEAIHQGRLREDLYSRLNTFAIELPLLRDRLEDIPALVEAFIKQSAETNRKTLTGADNECIEILRGYRWPGNVLQLRNVVERAMMAARGPMLVAADLPADIRRAGRKGPQFELRIGESLDEVEREFIFKTLDFTNGNKVRAAQILGISLKTLYNRLLRYHGKDRDPAPETPRNHHDN